MVYLKGGCLVFQLHSFSSPLFLLPLVLFKLCWVHGFLFWQGKEGIKLSLQIMWNFMARLQTVLLQPLSKLRPHIRYCEAAGICKRALTTQRIIELKPANLPCWNCSSTICRLESDTAYWLTCSWEVRSCASASSLCFTTPLSCSCRDSTCMLACWLEADKERHRKGKVKGKLLFFFFFTKSVQGSKWSKGCLKLFEL